uniref:Uncharacterized protein n=1 Tax=Aegilops tauschii subsp. strangulata TaxID=200361 RepID=A0A453LZB7_AEGTS
QGDPTRTPSAAAAPPSNPAKKSRFLGEENPSQVAHGSCHCRCRSAALLLFFLLPFRVREEPSAPYIYLDSLSKAARLLCFRSPRKRGRGGDLSCHFSVLTLGTLGLLLLIEWRTVVLALSREVSSVVRSSEQWIDYLPLSFSPCARTHEVLSLLH